MVEQQPRSSPAGGQPASNAARSSRPASPAPGRPWGCSADAGRAAGDRPTALRRGEQVAGTTIPTPAARALQPPRVSEPGERLLHDVSTSARRPAGGATAGRPRHQQQVRLGGLLACRSYGSGHGGAPGRRILAGCQDRAPENGVIRTRRSRRRSRRSARCRGHQMVRDGDRSPAGDPFIEEIPVQACFGAASRRLVAVAASCEVRRLPVPADRWMVAKAGREDPRTSAQRVGFDAGSSAAASGALGQLPLRRVSIWSAVYALLLFPCRRLRRIREEPISEYLGP